MQVLILLISFGLSLVGMPLVMRLSYTVGAVDLPDDVRRRHAYPTPRLGGLWIYTVFFLTALVGASVFDDRCIALLTGGGLLVAAGVIDDVRGLRPIAKLLLQAAAGSCALLSLTPPKAYVVLGNTVHLPQGVSFVLCLLLCLAAINAVNLIDGADGLCGGVMAVVLLTCALIGLRRGDAQAVMLSLLLCAPVLAFLIYNRPPAVIFLGDAGAQLLGLAAVVLLLPHDGGTARAGSLVILAIPLLELFVSLVRRLARGKNPFAADEGHLHQRLLRYGMSPYGVALSYTALAAGCALIGYALTFSL